jgi:hypothetical protein
MKAEELPKQSRAALAADRLTAVILLAICIAAAFLA